MKVISLAFLLATIIVPAHGGNTPTEFVGLRRCTDIDFTNSVSLMGEEAGSEPRPRRTGCNRSAKATGGLLGGEPFDEESGEIRFGILTNAPQGGAARQD
jgi:hypothetical protein